MTSGGEAADQVVRLAFDGAEHVLRIAGTGAEHIIALLMAALKPGPKGQKQSAPKLRGRERLRTMLKSGAELKFFEIKGADLKEFAAAAKQYGLAYCVLRVKGNENGMVEVMAKAEDAARISRIMEKLEMHDLGGVTHEPGEPAKAKRRIPIISALMERLRGDSTAPAVPEQDVQELVDDLLAQPPAKEGRAEPEAHDAVQPEVQTARPPARTEMERTNPPSAPSSQTRSKGDGIISDKERKPSVKAYLDERTKAKQREQKPSSKSRQQRRSQQSRQPQRKKIKPKKER